MSPHRKADRHIKLLKWAEAETAKLQRNDSWNELSDRFLMNMSRWENTVPPQQISNPLPDRIASTIDISCSITLLSGALSGLLTLDTPGPNLKCQRVFPSSVIIANFSLVFQVRATEPGEGCRSSRSASPSWRRMSGARRWSSSGRRYSSNLR